MSKNARDNRPYVRPVTRLELSEKNIKFRWIAIVVLLAIGVVSIGYGFSGLLSQEPGWQEITVQPGVVNCSSEFVFMYNFGAGDVNPTLQHKKLEALYGELTVSAYQLFSPEAVSETGGNLRSVNAGINQAVTVDPALFEALELVAHYDNRHVFLAPVTELYEAVFLSAGDGEARAFDPNYNEDKAELVKLTSGYCSDPAHISLEILGENQVRLNVSEAYLAFAQEYGIETFLDFGWMKNAFIADYLAQGLAAEGHTFGYVASYDGFTRNLDVSGEGYGVNIFHRRENTVQIPAKLSYSVPMSIVSLRDYPLSEQDRWHYYGYETGEITSVYLDTADGTCKSAVDSLLSYSEDKGCGEILLQIAPLFTVDTLDVAALAGLTTEQVYCVWAEGDAICHTQENAALTLLPESGGDNFRLEYVK